MKGRLILGFAVAVVSSTVAVPSAHGGRFKDCWENCRERWEYCGLAKPKPTGPMNNCYGYFHTGWRAWTPECQPCPSQIPMVSMAPPAKSEPAPPPVTTPTQPVTPPVPPAAEKGDKIGAASNRATVIRVVATQPPMPKAAPPVTRSSDSGWSPVPATQQPNR